MSRLADNMERHPAKPGEYLAYDATGKAFRCTQTRFGGWKWFATPSHAGKGSDGRVFYADTLRQLAANIGRSRFTPEQLRELGYSRCAEELEARQQQAR